MINDRIRFPQVRVVDDKNGQLGIFPVREAVEMARDRGVDLVLVAAQAQPPVCRLIAYGKYKYEQSKSGKTKKTKGTELKMVRLHPGTGTHDRDILVRHSERFLREGHKVRVVCQFKGRENAYPELGKRQLDAVAEGLAEISIVEGQITKQGRDMTMMLTPKPGIKPLPKPTRDGKGKKEEEDEAEFAQMQAELAQEAKAEGGVSDDDEAGTEDETDVEGTDDFEEDAEDATPDADLNEDEDEEA